MISENLTFAGHHIFEGMTSPPMNQITEAYQAGRQSIHDLKRRYNLTTEDFRQPDKVFQILLEKGRKSKVRTKLSNPHTREHIKAKLQ